MKLEDLLEEAVGDKNDGRIHEWWVDQIHVEVGYKTYTSSHLTVEKGCVYYDGATLRLDCRELKYPIGKVANLRFEGHGEHSLASLNFFPDKKGVVTNAIFAGGQSIEKIDHRIVCKELVFARNKIKSLKDIHKFVECEEIVIWNNPIEDGVLDLLRIPGIEKINDGSHAELMSEFDKPNKAIAIVSKYVGKGPKGIVKAHQELIDNDLEDFA